MKNKDTVRLVHPYGPLKRSLEYPVLGEGYDYVTVKRGGSHIHVPNCLIAPAGYRFEEDRWEREEDEDEEYYN